MITLASIQVGRIRSEGDAGGQDVTRRAWTTGFYKLPVKGPAELRQTGLVGDAVADTRNHGGPDKAVLCYALSHYQRWSEEFPQLDFRGGGFGENFTVLGGDESDVCLGDRYRLGNTEVQVSQPRQPCWKISRRWQEKTMTKRVAQTGRTGWYLRVLTEGTVSPGEPFEPLERPHPDWPVARANDVMFGREVDRAATIELMNLPELSPDWKAGIA